jgi:predicted phage-related endonuclease
MAEELSAEITSIQDAIKAHMTAQGVDSLTGTDYKVSWKEVTSSRLDGKALKAALPELAAQYTKQTTSRRFVLSA